MIDQTLVRPSGSRASRPPAVQLGPEELAAALRALPHGGLDESTRRFEVSPTLRGSLAPIIVAIRWAALAYGMIFVTKSALAGDLGAVLSLGICLFVTSWRSVIPLRLDSPELSRRLVAVTDAMLLGLAVGYAGGPRSSLVFCMVAAVAIAALGWGYVLGAITAIAAFVAMGVGSAIDGNFDRFTTTASLVLAVALALIVLVMGLIRGQLLAAERRRRDLAGRVDALAETNDLLTMLNSVARTLPASLSQREAIENIRDELLRPFQPTVICLVEYDDVNDEWAPKLAEGCVLRPTMTTSELPPPLEAIIGSSRPKLVANLSTHPHSRISPSSGSGLYVSLQTRGRLVGLLGLEHSLVDNYDDRDRRLLGGLADVLALTLDNSRRFSRLRSLGAEEERSRIARDLHDRLGQWLTYISFELEGIIASGSDSSPQLSRLYQDVQRALDELRETLRQLRSGVTASQPLSVVGRELVSRFVERTGIEVTWSVTSPDDHLPVGVENELLRILQESLSNIDKHSDAQHATASWEVEGDTGTLTVRDDGRGFDTTRGVRDSAYGLVGMRERADAIGARLTISSEPGQGTTIVVAAGSAIPASKES
ncbi:MAG TPA: GAF domain-containing sensor histidine kinase [Microthrixaceae bacterium]|nr:GAF domain-containing sensor histidine kinase [Microthrixaceae bacterium]